MFKSSNASNGVSWYCIISYCSRAHLICITQTVNLDQIKRVSTDLSRGYYGLWVISVVLMLFILIRPLYMFIFNQL